MKYFTYITLILSVVFLTSCSPKTKPASIPRVEATPSPTPTIVIKNTLSFSVNESEHIDDIINTLCKTFKFKRDDVIKEMEKSDYESFLMNSSVKSYKRFEGIPCPKKYVFEEGTSISKILLSFINDSEDRFTKIHDTVNDDNSLKPYEQLILASIVEKECLANKQENEVASVFLNRLRNKSKLKSCVTVEYALGFEKPFLTSNDVKVDNPYNTYTIQSLPPTAISIPDDAALKAAMRKSSNNYCYFVYDYIDNNIEFSSNYTQHKKISSRLYKKYLKESKIPPRSKVKKGIKLEAVSK